MLKKVAIAVNNDEASKHAFTWALENIIDPTKHSLIIFSVVEPLVQEGYHEAIAGTLYLPSYIDELYEKATDLATKTIRDYNAIAEQHFEKLGKKLESKLIVGKGEVRDEIVDFVEEERADMLIIGSRGMGALKRTFVGSTSDYCIHHVHCPVLVIKPAKQ
jgi:nucleotide-binding universal stress UspA family protein